jgi:hypothetical protein
MLEEKEDAREGDEFMYEADERDWARTRSDGLAISRKTKTLIIMNIKEGLTRGQTTSREERKQLTSNMRK